MKQLVLFFLGIALLVLWGCSENSNPAESESSDEQAILEMIQDVETSDDADYFYASLDDESEDTFTDAVYKPFDTFLSKPIVPLRFGRVGRPILKDIRIIFNTDTTATVYFRKILRGNFVVLAADNSIQDMVSMYRVVRPMGHEFQRVAHFARRGDAAEQFRKGWRLVDFSMALGQSMSAEDSNADVVNPTLQITKLLIEADNTYEITDPLEYFQTKENMFTFSPGEEVIVTVHVKNETLDPVVFPEDQGTELVRLHFARHRHRRFHGIRNFKWIGEDDEGNNMYQGAWTVMQRLRIHHTAIDVIDNGTIFDDDIEKYPYNSVTWSSPYKVKLQD
jgi:hypothetical protein